MAPPLAVPKWALWWTLPLPTHESEPNREMRSAIRESRPLQAVLPVSWARWLQSLLEESGWVRPLAPRARAQTESVSRRPPRSMS